MVSRSISAIGAAVFALSLGAFMPGEARAAACIANTPIDLTNPDAQLQNSNTCGVINNLANANESTTEAAIEAATGLTLTHIDRDSNGATDSDNWFVFSGTTGGSWAIDTTGIGSGNFVISFKDGDPLAKGLVWFIIDTSLNTPSPCASPYELCGTWLMYGENGTRKQVSHADLFGYGTAQVPEPSTLLLLSLVLGGLGFAMRRRT